MKCLCRVHEVIAISFNRNLFKLAQLKANLWPTSAILLRKSKELLAGIDAIDQISVRSKVNRSFACAASNFK